MIENEEDLFKYFELEYNVETPRANKSIKLSERVYRDTACGAWAKLLPDGVLFGSIVEGSDAEVNTDPLKYPFPEKDIAQTLAYIEGEADLLWHEANDEAPEAPTVHIP